MPCRWQNSTTPNLEVMQYVVYVMGVNQLPVSYEHTEQNSRYCTHWIQTLFKYMQVNDKSVTVASRHSILTTTLNNFYYYVWLRCTLQWSRFACTPSSLGQTNIAWSVTRCVGKTPPPSRSPRYVYGSAVRSHKVNRTCGVQSRSCHTQVKLWASTETESFNQRTMTCFC